MEKELKRCCTCKQELVLSCFHNCKSNKDGKAHICKDCHYKAQLKWKAKPGVKEHLTKYAREYARAMRAELKELRRLNNN